MIADMVDEHTSTVLTDFTRYLQHYILVDVGKVMRRTKESYAVVQLANGDVVEDIELVFAGGNLDIVGKPCLVFTPRTPVFSVDTMIIKNSAAPYSRTQAKALVIDNSFQRHVQYGYVGGDWCLIGENYSIDMSARSGNAQLPVATLSFDSQCVELTTKAWTKYIDAIGRTIVVRYNGMQVINATEYAVDGTVKFFESPGGAVSRDVLYNPSQGNWNITKTTLPTGEITYDIKDQVTIGVTASGQLNITLAGDINIISKGACNLTLTGNTVITSPDTLLTGGKVTVGGAVAPTGQGALCGIPYCCFTGAPQTGPTTEGA